MRISFLFILIACPLLANPPREATAKTAKSSSSQSTIAAQAPILDFTGLDDSRIAGERTKTFLAKLGYDPKLPTGNPAAGIWITDMDFGITVRALVDGDGIDRLVISCGIPGKGAAVLNDLKALQALNKLNSNFNTCTFLLTPDGDLAFGTSLNFSDTLDAKTFRDHVRFLQGFIAYFLGARDPDIAEDRDRLVK